MCDESGGKLYNFGKRFNGKNYGSGLVTVESFTGGVEKKGSSEKPYTITLMLHQRHNEANYARQIMLRLIQ